MAISTHVVQTYARLWIVGPPGTGKSCAAFAFACSLKRFDGDLNLDWDVLWIHRPARLGAPLQCNLFRGQNEKWTCVIAAKKLDTLLLLLSEKAFVFLDGYVKPDKIVALELCELWRLKNKKCHRLVIVSSMVSMGKDWRPGGYHKIPSVVTSSFKGMAISSTVPNADQVKFEQLFKLFSWSLGDYGKALENDAFFYHVKSMFGATSMVSIEERMELLEEKFFVVGGSARMMFDDTTENAISALRGVLNAVPDIYNYPEGMVGISSPNVLNRLFAWYPDSQDSSRRTIVSKFVAREISLRLGPGKLQALANCLATNPSMDGYMFEMWFFSSLVTEGVQCYTIGDNGEVCETVWSTKNLTRFDPSDGITLNQYQQWFAPKKWNQGGYDAVFVDYQLLDRNDIKAKMAGFTSKILVRFVQVTRSDKHSFKVDFFKNLLSSTVGGEDNTVWLHRVEVCFVVPNDVVDAFTVPVDELTFRRNGLEPALPSNRNASTDIRICVVGFIDDKLEETTVGEKRPRHS